MVKFREKWLAALGFAILLHILLFSVLYINQDKNVMNNSSIVKETNTSQRDINNIDNGYKLVDSSTYTTTSELTKKPLKIDNEQKENLENLKPPTTEDREKKPLVSQNDNENKIKLTTIYNRNLQEKDKDIEVKPIIKTEIVLRENVNSLDKIKKNSDIISRDMPTQKVEVHIDSEYDLIKEELEEVNIEISNAINEIKKHNQKKIDQIQQGYSQS